MIIPASERFFKRKVLNFILPAVFSTFHVKVIEDPLKNSAVAQKIS
jgi:hypothetical protein